MQIEKIKISDEYKNLVIKNIHMLNKKISYHCLYFTFNERIKDNEIYYIQMTFNHYLNGFLTCKDMKNDIEKYTRFKFKCIEMKNNKYQVTILHNYYEDKYIFIEN